MLASVVLLTTGCVVGAPDWYRRYQQPYRAHPDLDRRVKTVRVLSALPPDIKIYELTAGGVQDLRDDWSAAGRDAVFKGLTEVFHERGIAVRQLTVDNTMRAPVEDVTVLYRAVSSSIVSIAPTAASGWSNSTLWPLLLANKCWLLDDSPSSSVCSLCQS